MCSNAFNINNTDTQVASYDVLLLSVMLILNIYWLAMNKSRKNII